LRRVRIPGVQYRFYTISESAWAAMLEAIRGARHSIYLESFILTDDHVTHNFFETLKSKARAGVQVKIIVDRVGHFWFGSVDKKEFEDAGAEILFFNRWLYRSHRKVLLVDEQVAFLGGVNVRGEYAKWIDLHVKLTGLLVKSLLKSFSRVYAIAGGKDPAVLALRKSKPASQARLALYKAKSWLIDHWPLKGTSALRYYYRRKCATAQKSIVIVTPYFIPNRWLIRSLQRAANRGVKIEVIVPQKTDVALADVSHRIFAENLKNFAKFLFLPEMNHAKVLLIDDREGLVGSNNIDAQSFDFNLELSVVFRRKDMTGDLKKIIEDWKAKAIPFEQIGYRKKWYHAIVRFIVKLLQPIL